MMDANPKGSKKERWLVFGQRSFLIVVSGSAENGHGPISMQFSSHFKFIEVIVDRLSGFTDLLGDFRWVGLRIVGQNS